MAPDVFFFLGPEDLSPCCVRGKSPDDRGRNIGGPEPTHRAGMRKHFFNVCWPSVPHSLKYLDKVSSHGVWLLWLSWDVN